MKPSWTCFHCGETFKTTGSARDHFGETPEAEPGCLVRVRLGAERGLLMALREAEAVIARYTAEDSDVHRSMAALQSRHGDQLHDAEEAGYARGLRDAHVTTPAAVDVLAERRRQIEVEGWTAKHDDEHGDRSMSIAAACYALADSRAALEVQTLKIERLWQWTGWAALWFKPKDQRSNLVRAGALILAEIERLDRAAG